MNIAARRAPAAPCLPLLFVCVAGELHGGAVRLHFRLSGTAPPPAAVVPAQLGEWPGCLIAHAALQQCVAAPRRLWEGRRSARFRPVRAAGIAAARDLVQSMACCACCRCSGARSSSLRRQPRGRSAWWRPSWCGACACMQGAWWSPACPTWCPNCPAATCPAATAF